ncbi:TetR/AcrR family transcriptional regulator C-terminal ligand-binding domain-containing protein [Actinophytocola sediminis]
MTGASPPPDDAPAAVSRTGTGPPVDHRKGPRRRGDALHKAIYDATLAELRDVGYAKLTMDGIVRRARTSKSSVHRRWSSVAELVIAALANTSPRVVAPPDTGSLRGDLLELLRRAADRLAGPEGEAARGLIGTALLDPTLAEFARAHIIDVPSEEMTKVLQRAVSRGDAHADAVNPMVAKTGQILLRHHFFVYGGPIPDHLIVDIVDDVVLPLVRA